MELENLAAVQSFWSFGCLLYEMSTGAQPFTVPEGSEDALLILEPVAG